MKNAGRNSILFLTLCALIALSFVYYFYSEHQNHKVKEASLSLNRNMVASEPTPTLTPDPEFTFHLPVLMYHYVEHVTDLRDTIRQKMAVSPGFLENQIKTLLEKGYSFHFARDIPDVVTGKIPYNGKIVFLTFDDGYEDFYTDVFPILKKYHVKATSYVVYDFIGKYNYMNLSQIIEVKNSGLVEIGSHTMNHRPLKGLSEKEKEIEISQSKTKLEDILGGVVESFAYPYGSFDVESTDLVKKAGYTSAVTTVIGTDMKEKDIYLIKRVRPNHSFN